MALSDMRNANNIISKSGSEFGMIALLDTNGAVTGSWVSMPVIANTEHKDSTDTPSEPDEGGNTIYLQGGQRKASVVFDVMQQDKASDQFPLDYGGSNFAIVKQDLNYTVNSGKSQFTIYPNAKLQKNYSRSSKNLGNQWSFDIMPSTTALTLNLTSITVGSNRALTCASCAVASGTYSLTVEL